MLCNEWQEAEPRDFRVGRANTKQSFEEALKDGGWAEFRRECGNVRYVARINAAYTESRIALLLMKSNKSRTYQRVRAIEKKYGEELMNFLASSRLSSGGG